VRGDSEEHVQDCTMTLSCCRSADTVDTSSPVKPPKPVSTGQSPSGQADARQDGERRLAGAMSSTSDRAVENGRGLSTEGASGTGPRQAWGVDGGGGGGGGGGSSKEAAAAKIWSDGLKIDMKDSSAPISGGKFLPSADPNFCYGAENAYHDPLWGLKQMMLRHKESLKVELRSPSKAQLSTFARSIIKQNMVAKSFRNGSGGGSASSSKSSSPTKMGPSFAQAQAAAAAAAEEEEGVQDEKGETGAETAQAGEGGQESAEVQAFTETGVGDSKQL